ncbi:NADH dehydrogenase [ubiquinone] 1 alpha subcomplex subunit 13-like [Anneissia japonica]|uniref:NADH dehydrogenase [ubiquinone] 1 alpha subcomplex subunit 13-like n=1 Tax=Anneissia japonica TaxID=1529436 RepID=UPI001425921D|nr:NADH dehydrogenase [ubiquinone] 1 alpha subcomplex subunit 13-like [Anneissia japonica]
MATSFRQDLPPKGGYGPIDYKRHIPKRGFSGYAMFAGCAAIMATGYIMLKIGNKHRRRLQQEDREAYLAIMPLIEVETDRDILKRLKFNQEQEAIIMKDVPGWNIGESVYNTDRWVEPCIEDLYFLAPNKEKNKASFGYHFYV